jgi:ubiquinone biosynthesis protein COQ9
LKPRSHSHKNARVKDARRQGILLAVLAQVPFDGWTETAYAHGLKHAGITRGEADLLLPGGIRDVIDQFGEWTDSAMLEKIHAEPGYARFRVRDKIAFAMRARLEALIPHREAMRRLMFWYAMPLHAPLGLRRLYKTVDLIWRKAGDTATDFNFYSKRGLLAFVLKTTVLFWLDDETPGCGASWEFLDRRIGEVLRVGKSISLMKEWKPSEIFVMVRQRVKRA